MRKRTGVVLLTGGLAVILTIFMGTTLEAHHPLISAAAECDTSTGLVMINYTSTSWTFGPGGGNTRIEISVYGVVKDAGAYVAPTYSFSGSFPAPAGAAPGDTVEVFAVAVDAWDDGWPAGATTFTTVTIPSTACVGTGSGRFTGGGHQIRIGAARVTRGLTIHCDLLLSNNLEVNWGGNQFHMTEHLQTVACTDDPAIIQAPPVAPLDTLVGVGTGRYNGADGYTIEFTLVDAGEPGGEDQAALLIYETANPANIVLNVPLQLLTGGNLQAHYDQPHK